MRSVAALVAATAVALSIAGCAAKQARKSVPRRPAAAVAVNMPRGIVYCLVGEDGVRLPKTYTRWPLPSLAVPLLTGVCAAPPSPGEAWAEKSVTDAVQIVRKLQASDVIRRGVNITAVDVSNFTGRINRTRSEFRVLAENNCVIDWGRAPGTTAPGELPAEEKVAKLERFLRDRHPTSNRTLDLRFAGRVLVRRRLGRNGDSS